MKILFVCVENACRSQMAEGIFNHLAKGGHLGVSGGISPDRKMNPLSITVLKEIDIDISHNKPKLISPDILKGVDKIISMGCIQGCSAVRIDEDWKIEDPKGKGKGKGIEKFREVRDAIYKKVKDLVERIEGNKL